MALAFLFRPALLLSFVKIRLVFLSLRSQFSFVLLGCFLLLQALKSKEFLSFHQS